MVKVVLEKAVVAVVDKVVVEKDVVVERLLLWKGCCRCCCYYCCCRCSKGRNCFGKGRLRKVVKKIAVVAGLRLKSLVW